MEQSVISARKRENLGTGAARQYRRDGAIPAVVYGYGLEPMSLSVDSKELFSVLRQGASLVNLKVEGDATNASLGALIKDVSRDPISRDILSVDFQWVSLTEKVQVSVPLHLEGEAPGVKVQGGSLEQTLHEIQIACLPTAIPEFIAADISNLSTGQSLHVRDIAVIEGIEFITSLDESVAVITKGIKAEDLEVHVEEGVPSEEAAGETSED